MLAMTRELLLERLLELGPVTDLYSAHDPAYVTEALSWIEATERALARLRHPLAGFAAAERGRVLAARDGMSPAGVAGERTSPRRLERAAAAGALSRLECALREAVVAADAILGPLADQMAQLVGHVSAMRPIPVQGSSPREEWLRAVWRDLAVDGDTSRQLHAYLAARLTAVDRLYLLGDALAHALSGTSEQALPRPLRASGGR